MNLLIVIGLLAAVLPPAEQGSGTPSGETILRKVEEQLAGVRDYTVNLEIIADIEQLSIPPSRAVMYFKYPDKVRFDAQGFALVPREALTLTPARILQHFSVDRVERETVNGDHAFRLTLIAKAEGTRLRTAELTIDARRWTIDRITAALPDRRTLEARFVHRQTGGHWLPMLLTVTFATPPDDHPDLPAPEDQNPAVSRRSPARNGTLTIRYLDYRLSTGLSDSLFTADPHRN
jgi:hypothetical protein